VEGRSLPDGRALLVWLTECASQPDFTLRREHQVGDLVVWDNCGSLHRAVPYDADSGRVLHRTSVAGEARVS
jgi:alpha-ketoglutarate-dependent taurine dioxygenase